MKKFKDKILWCYWNLKVIKLMDECLWKIEKEIKLTEMEMID